MPLPDARLHVALDQNFPVPIVEAHAHLLPRTTAVRHVHVIDPRLARLDDWKLVIELEAAGWHVLATNDDSLLDDPQTMVALEETALSLMVIDRQGTNALRASGIFLTHLQYVLGQHSFERPQVWHLREVQRTPFPPKHYIGKIARKQRVAVQELRDRYRVPTT